MKREGGGGVRGSRGRPFLISVNVIPSSGPIRFIVHEGDHVSTVIKTTLQNYSKEGRLPDLGFYVDDFVLYSTESALGAGETIGASGCRKFLMCMKKQLEKTTKAPEESTNSVVVNKARLSIRVWKSRNIKLPIFKHYNKLWKKKLPIFSQHRLFTDFVKF